MSSGRISRREVTAQETRRAILDAALALFTERGYGATSIADIAEAAGVAVPTIYTSVGRKPDLLRGTLDRLDEVADIPELASQIAVSADPGQVIALSVKISRQLNERAGDVIAALASAAGVEPGIAEIYAGGMARHQAGAEAVVRRLAELDGLRPGLTAQAAAAIAATLTHHRVWAELTRAHSWTYAQASDWIEETLRHSLLSAADLSR